MLHSKLVPQQSISSSGTDGSKTDLNNLNKSGIQLPPVGFSQTTAATAVPINNELHHFSISYSVPYSYQVISMNESKAKQMCKKRAPDVIAHTETQMIRCYPNARRFDSSNFSPINFWSCGIQLVALNYQTIDSFQILNLAFFEQNANAGYVLKPQVLWNRQHPEYGRFNPYEKKKDGDYLSLTVKVISGQYLTENVSSGSSQMNAPAASSFNIENNGDYNSSFMNSSQSNSYDASAQFNSILHQHRSSGVEMLQSSTTYVELELIGIQCDCMKEKTKAFGKNALNPVWNEEFTFHVTFPELAFLKFTVMDSSNNHVISQRIVPLKYLKQGYRHLRMRTAQNQPLELSSLFVHTRQSVEHASTAANAQLGSPNNNSIGIGLSAFNELKAPTKHKQFKLNIYGIIGDGDEEKDNGVQIKVTQETTVQQAIEMVRKKSSSCSFK